MLAATNLSRSLIMRSALVCSISFSLGSTALAAESEASSMASGMPDSGATVSASSMAAVNGANQSTGSSSSHSSSERSTAASAYDSSLKGAGSAVAVKNVATDKTALRNPVLPARGASAIVPATAPAAANRNALIENDAKQKAADFATSGGATGSAHINGAGPSTVTVNRVPHAKVQYWNQHKKNHRVQH
jgi:hypothetical protein